jgi:hypothetical protein
VEAGREAAQLDLGCVLGGALDQCAAATGVAGAHVAQVAVEAARLDQARERDLVERGRAAVVDLLLLDRGAQPWRAHIQPTRSAGASALETVPIAATRSGAAAHCACSSGRWSA